MSGTGIVKRLFGRQEEDQEQQNEVQARFDAGRILVVDDSKTFQAVTKKMLQAKHFAVLQAMDAEEGIHIARYSQPDLIIMDVVMPGMNGYQATRHIKREPETSHIPVIIVSGNKQAAEHFWVLQIGAADYISKPFSKDDLIRVVEKHLQSEPVQ